MAEFVVTWTVDLEADSPEHAARLALEMQRDPESTATVFDVLEWADQSHTVSTTSEVDMRPVERMEYLRGQIHAESISMGEIAELQGYGEAGLIPAGDVELREWAGLPEFPDDTPDPALHTSFYTSEDHPVGGTWSVYSEQYVNSGDSEPIDGSQALVQGGLPTEQAADQLARTLYLAARHDSLPEAPERRDYNVCEDGGPHGPVVAHIDPEIDQTHVSVSCRTCGISTGFPIAELIDKLEWN